MTAQPRPDDRDNPAEVVHGVADAMKGLEDLDTLPVADHVGRFNAVHDSLTAALSSIDEL